METALKSLLEYSLLLSLLAYICVAYQICTFDTMWLPAALVRLRIVGEI